MGPFRRLRRVFRLGAFRESREEDVREEIDFYIAMRARELVAEGLEESEARTKAEEMFGDRDRIERETLQWNPGNKGRGRMAFSDELQRVRQVARGLARRPGFTATVLITLGLGVGGSAAMFTVVNSVLVRPLPYAAPEQLVSISETTSRTTSRSSAPLNYLDLREGSTALTHVAAYRVRARNLLGEGEPERLVAGNVSANFFATFGVDALVGRTFDAAAARPGDTRSVVLSHDLWVRRFGSDPSVVGRTVFLDRESVPVLGVMPSGFRVPEDADLWIKAWGDVPDLGVTPSEEHLEMRDAWYFQTVARLAPGVTLAQAQGELDGIAARIRQVSPESNAETGFMLTPLHEATVSSARTSLLLLLGARGSRLRHRLYQRGESRPGPFPHPADGNGRPNGPGCGSGRAGTTRPGGESAPRLWGCGGGDCHCVRGVAARAKRCGGVAAPSRRGSPGQSGAALLGNGGFSRGQRRGRTSRPLHSQHEWS